VQDVNDLRHCLTDVWAGVEQSIIDIAIAWPVAQKLSMSAFEPQEDILNIHGDRN